MHASAQLALFCLAATNALTVWAAAVLGQCLPRQREAVVHVPGLGPCPLLGVACWPPAAALAVTWAVVRNQWTAGAWVLQDLMGVALMLLVLRTLRLNLRVACLLLPAAFFYDVSGTPARRKFGGRRTGEGKAKRLHACGRRGPGLTCLASPVLTLTKREWALAGVPCRSFGSSSPRSSSAARASWWR